VEQILPNYLLSLQATFQSFVQRVTEKGWIKEGEVEAALKERHFRETGNAENAELKLHNFRLNQDQTRKFFAVTAIAAKKDTRT